MENTSWDKQIARQRRVMRLVDALEAAERWQLSRTAQMYVQALESIGCWRDAAGDWREDTRPIKPISADLPGTWADNHADF